MDVYSKTILTVIAACLIVIAVKQVEPSEAHAGPFDGAVTFGDVMDLQEIKDPTAREEAFKKINRRLPLVRIHGGFVSAHQ